jgi:hypothetical protein
MPDVPGTRSAHLLIDGEPVGLDRVADAVAVKVIERLRQHGIIEVSGIRSHRRKEGTTWCDKRNPGDESMDRTPIGDSGESSWSMKMANEIIATSRRKKMQNR